MPDPDQAGPPLPGVMPDRLPENAPRAAPDFDPVAIAKDLLRTTRAGALATLDRNTGHPFASLVNVATDSDGAPVILISRLSTHTANLEADTRASVLLAATGKGDPLAHPRLTLLGSFAAVPATTCKPSRLPRILPPLSPRHPKSESMPGFAYFRPRLGRVSVHRTAALPVRGLDWKASECYDHCRAGRFD